MKKLNTLLTVAVIGCVGGASGGIQAGNYRPTNTRTNYQPQSIQLERNTAQARDNSTPPAQIDETRKSSNNTAGQKTAYGPQPMNGVKTANCYDSCYTVPVCGPTYCTPIVRCSSPCGTRPYFPASPVYSTPSYSNYGGFGGYPNYGVGGYGGYNGGFGGYGGGLGNYGAGYGGGIYSNPGLGVPYNQGIASPYNGGVINSPYINPVGGGMPGYYPSNYNAGYAPGIVPVNQPYYGNGAFGNGGYGNGGYGSPIISQPMINSPIYSDPIYNSPFYP